VQRDDQTAKKERKSYKLMADNLKHFTQYTTYYITKSSQIVHIYKFLRMSTTNKSS